MESETHPPEEPHPDEPHGNGEMAQEEAGDDREAPLEHHPDEATEPDEE